MRTLRLLGRRLLAHVVFERYQYLAGTVDLKTQRLGWKARLSCCGTRERFGVEMGLVAVTVRRG